jgi:hypothetical protein
MSIRITHIHFSSNIHDHEHIADVRWTNREDGSTGASSKAVVVDWIDNKQGVAYVGVGSSQVPVHTVHPSGSAPYLRTRGDGQWTNNLLALPEF